MAGSLLLLLDDIASVLDDVAAMTKVAATKTAGVLGDDLALNAKQLTGVNASRELPVVWSVARGSFRNKLILVPAALAISWVVPWAVRPLLMLGGAYLCYEGMEKLFHRLRPAHGGRSPPPAAASMTPGAGGPTTAEGTKVAAAIRTDFILSAEIIVITLGVVADQPLVVQVAVLAGIAVAMTVGVYGVVAGIVKLDDIGAALVLRGGRVARWIGRGILAVAPWLLRGLAVAGTIAMFLVGGGIIAHAIPVVHEAVHAASPPGWDGLLSFAVDGVVGLLVGGVSVAVGAAVSWFLRRAAILVVFGLAAAGIEPSVTTADETQPPVAAADHAQTPVTGTAVPELGSLDAVMTAFMSERSIPAGSLAVMREGRLVMSRGYGFADADRLQPVQPTTPFRLASLTKPLTAAAVRRLMAAGRLAADARVFDLLGLDSSAGTEFDDRWRSITVEHLLTHRAGFDREQAGDPMFRSRTIAAALGIPSPPSAADTVRFMTGRPLQFDPGLKQVYSNFGYCLLGRIVEQVTGASYEDHLRGELLAPLDIHSIRLGRSLPEHRDPHEPCYLDPGRVESVFGPAGGPPVPFPDGGFHLEAMDAHGGLIGSAPDLVMFLRHHDMDGQRVEDGVGRPGAFFGSLPGTFTLMLRRADGIAAAALFNQRTDASGLAYDAILARLQAALSEVSSWPQPAR